MSQEQSSIPSSTPAAPPPSAPAVTAPPSAPPAPAAAPQAPPAPVAPAESVAAVPPGASTPEKPKTYDEARAKLHAARDRAMAEGEAQPASETPEAEPIVAKPEPETPPVIDVPEVEPAPEVETAPEKSDAVPAEESDVDLDDINHVLTAEEIEQKYKRGLSKEARADFAAREARRGELETTVRDIGGKYGAGVFAKMAPAFFTDCPFDEAKQPTEAEAWWNEQADVVLDQMVLPENAGALGLFKAMSQRFTNTAIYDPDTGAAYVSNLIKGEWGQQPDGQTPYDLPFVDSLMQAHKKWGVQRGYTGTEDDDGKPIIDPARAGKPYDVATIDKLIKADQKGLINHEFIDNELSGTESAKREPTPRELELEEENKRLKAEGETEKTAREARAAEQKREHERLVGQYKTQAKGYVSRQVMATAMPILQSVGWAPSEGDSPEVAEEKKTLAEMVTATVNAHLQSDMEEINGAIDRFEAFDANGRATPRFSKKLEPFQNKAKAKVLRLIKLNSRFKFAAGTSRNAQLAKKNGSIESPVVPPPIATAPKAPDPNAPVDWDERQRLAKEKLHAKLQAAKGEETVGRL